MTTNNLLSKHGHSIPREQVSEWLGLHYGKNFDTEGANQASWVERFVQSHEDEYQTYLVFEDATKRWTYQLSACESDQGLLAAQQKIEGNWIDIDHLEMINLESEIEASGLVEDYATNPSVSCAIALPGWAEEHLNNQILVVDFPKG